MWSTVLANAQVTQNTAPLALMLTLGLVHRSLRTRGFTLRRSARSTDTIVSLLVVLMVNLWTLLVLTPSVRLIRQNGYSASSIRAALATVSPTPWIAELFSWFWLSEFLSSYWYVGDRSRSDQLVGLWKMDCSNGPFGWRESSRPWARNVMFLAMATIMIPLGLVAIYQGDVLYGVLSIAAFALFVVPAFPHNKYTESPHRHDGNMLRIALPTSHLEGTVYVLPSRDCGFEAVWSPKVKAEHLQTDAEIMSLFSSMRTGSYSLAEPLRRLRATLSAYNEGAILSNQQVTDLAEWLLLDPSSTIAGKPWKAKRPQGVHLIGRDLIYAIAHAEYLVFMRKKALPVHLCKKLGLLRKAERSGGLEADDSTPTIGYKEGLPGYQEAVRHIYALFDEIMDPAALSPPQISLPHSSVLGRRPHSTEDYVGSLWTLCLEHSESTFSALYLFCSIWFIEVGNVGGFHIFPFQCLSHQGDQVAWQIIWRQGWYECIMAHMIASSPLIAFAFAAGLV